MILRATRYDFFVPENMTLSSVFGDAGKALGFDPASYTGKHQGRQVVPDDTGSQDVIRTPSPPPPAQPRKGTMSKRAAAQAESLLGVDDLRELLPSWPNGPEWAKKAPETRKDYEKRAVRVLFQVKFGEYGYFCCPGPCTQAPSSGKDRRWQEIRQYLGLPLRSTDQTSAHIERLA